MVTNGHTRSPQLDLLLTPFTSVRLCSADVVSKLSSMVRDLLATSATSDMQSAAYWAYHLGLRTPFFLASVSGLWECICTGSHWLAGATCMQPVCACLHACMFAAPVHFNLYLMRTWAAVSTGRTRWQFMD